MRPVPTIALLAIGLALAQPILAKERKPKPNPVAEQGSSAANAASAAAMRQLEAIARLDDAPDGPQLNSVIAFNPAAPQEAARL